MHQIVGNYFVRFLQATQAVCTKDFFFCWQLELAVKTCNNIFGTAEQHLAVFPGRTDCAGSALNFLFADLNVEELKRHPENSKIF